MLTTALLYSVLNSFFFCPACFNGSTGLVAFHHHDFLHLNAIAGKTASIARPNLEKQLKIGVVIYRVTVIVAVKMEHS